MMAATGETAKRGKTQEFGRWLLGPHMLAFVPAIALSAFWLAGEMALVMVALGLPLVYLLLGTLSDARGSRMREVDGTTGLPMLDRLEHDAEEALLACAETGRKTALFYIQLEEFDPLVQRYGQQAGGVLLQRLGERFRALLREHDKIYWLGGARYAVLIAPVPHFELESAIQLAARLQSAAEEPVSVDMQALYVSCAIGICLSARTPEASSPALLKAAEAALHEACRNAPSSIRAYSSKMGKMTLRREALVKDASSALDNGEIAPWFQPQISTDTGQVTGFEALARWQHPTRGTVPPSEFLPALEDSSQLERLGEVILYGALAALKEWDKAGWFVPCVAVNFSSDELHNPKLAKRIRWDLDRFNLTPDRLTIEVLETIVANSPEDAAVRNLAALAQMGCRVDLDDFGTGHASITAVRRFAIERIKIDRSFITRVDKDQEQQRMVSAIQTMAERLGLETLAEGVETAGEHAILGQLGCAHVQGYAIARPMPFDETFGWLENHNASLGALPQIRGKSA
ncbi:phosphodiesterase [Lentibacter sp. XHP0401]|uniref:putative bifunctional diguanylate cyclase/phosphodiesterase n=1 Tax=Lentibacter sp. XHP0401 TaxID=2984334 RepID=UPI00298123FD|nr:phosphodiesterase [Lentibacter sp. XHP0401]